MQPTPLLVSQILRFGTTLHADQEVVTWTADGPRRATYAEVGRQAAQLAHALHGLGVEGDHRVATFMWNNAEHFVTYLAVPSMGAVLHALNIRLFPEQILYVANHGGSKVVIVDNTLAAPFAKLLPHLPKVRHVVVNGPVDDDTRAALAAPEHVEAVHDWSTLLEGQPTTYDWPEDLDENSASSMCYTSGTTGNPKGVVVLAPLQLPPRRDDCDDGRHPSGRSAARRRPALPRQRVGLPLPRDGGGRLPRHAGPVPPGGPARDDDREREGHLRSRCADDLAGPAPPPRGEHGRRLDVPRPHRRRVGRAPRHDEVVQGAARHHHPPCVGHDRDVPDRHRGGAPGRGGGGVGRLLGLRDLPGTARPRRPGAAHRPGRRRGAVGRRERRRARGPRTVDHRLLQRFRRGVGERARRDGRQVPRRVAADRRRGHADSRRLPPAHRPRQGRHQVRRRVDQLGRPRERDHGAPGGARGLRRRSAGRAVG